MNSQWQKIEVDGENIWVQLQCSGLAIEDAVRALKRQYPDAQRCAIQIDSPPVMMEIDRRFITQKSAGEE